MAGKPRQYLCFVILCWGCDVAIKTIRSRDNAFVKQLIALAHSSRERRKAGLTVLDGIHLVRAYVDAQGAPHAIAVAESALEREEVVALLAHRAISGQVNVLADNLMAEASALESPAFLMATITTPEPAAIPTNASVLVLEDLQDPGNVGSLLRSAAAAGIEHILTSKTTAFAWSPKVLRAAQGAHFSINIVEGADVAAFLKNYRGRSLALVPRGEGVQSLYAQNLAGAIAILVGNEGSGLSAETLQAASRRVTIPMPGNIESLNAAAAGAICLFEMVRQRVPSKHS
ncbi:MAG: RNA methyltransferase [Betaproteobacteria bacterium]|nr:RNA methyltransferase [Betaproteobacteria bacterium]